MRGRKRKKEREIIVRIDLYLLLPKHKQSVVDRDFQSLKNETLIGRIINM